MAACIACRKPADLMQIAAATREDGEALAELAFSCPDCRARGVLKAALNQNYAWSFRGGPVAPVACPACGRDTHPSCLWACPECGRAGCVACMARHPETATCAECVGAIEVAAHGAGGSPGTVGAAIRAGIDTLAAKHAGGA